LYWAAAPQNFKARIHPTLTYEGYNKTHLVHFAAEFVAVEGLVGVSPQSIGALARLPGVEATDGSLRLSSLQSPTTNDAETRSSLDFLTDSEAEALMRDRLNCGAHA
jgi:hypothetical protein